MTFKSKTQPLCRCCGKPIPKQTCNVWFRRTKDGMARQDGEFWKTVDVEDFPATIAEVRKLTNQQVMSVRKGYGTSEGAIGRCSTWDGESYEDEFFCKGTCATTFAYAAACWKDGELTTKAYRDAMKARQGAKAA